MISRTVEHPVEWHGLSYDEYTMAACLAAIALSLLLESLDGAWSLVVPARDDPGCGRAGD